jgi:hypothetical protein
VVAADHREYQSTARASFSAPNSQTSPFSLRQSKLAQDQDALAQHTARVRAQSGPAVLFATP